MSLIIGLATPRMAGAGAAARRCAMRRAWLACAACAQLARIPGRVRLACAARNAAVPIRPGSQSAPRHWPTPPHRSGPTIQSAYAPDDASGRAVLERPPSGAWNSYELQVCQVAVPTSCVVNSLTRYCAVNATGPTTTCDFPGLSAVTAYTVSAVAQGSGRPSARSNNVTFTTLIP